MTLRGTKDKKSSDSDAGAAGTATNSNRPADGQRHGSTESSGADSYRSTDTIRGPFASMRTPMKVNTATRKLGYVDFFLVMTLLWMVRVCKIRCEDDGVWTSTCTWRYEWYSGMSRPVKIVGLLDYTEG